MHVIPTSLFVLALVGLLPTRASGQSHSLIGVLSDTDGRVLSVGFVSVIGAGRETMVDGHGVFRFDSLAAGPITLELSGLGMVTDTVEVQVTPEMPPQRFTLRDDPSLPLNHPPDPIPFELEGGLRTEFESTEDDLRLILTSEEIFPTLGRGLRIDTYSRPGVLGIVVLGGLPGGRIAPAALGPATGSVSLGDPWTFESVDIHLTHQATTDTIRLERAEWWVRIEDRVNGHAEVRDSLELVLPGTVRLQCVPAGHPDEACVQFLDDVSTRLGRWYSVPAADAYRRAFGSTVRPQFPSEGIVLIGRGVLEREVWRLRSMATEFTGRFGGHSGTHVQVQTSTGEVIYCHDGECVDRGRD